MKIVAETVKDEDKNSDIKAIILRCSTLKSDL